ncbi:unnamed protein product [Oncorhynchus mykiss]|uniref:Uncharacterized protein n=1 Tax=Oncorhynchus mykiss TaxID=8022 RepID=A0A060X8C5_ONCMY|nr:unnamed protein product [Oncorhynchus mykiss]
MVFQGSHIFHKLRPVDQLRHLLVCGTGGESEEVERFFKLHREDQACATALILSCSSAACDREVSQWATRAAFRYGGEAQMRFPSAHSAPSSIGALFGSPVPGSHMSVGSSPIPNPSFLTTPAPGMMPQSVSTPHVPDMPSAPIAGLSSGPEVVFSGKHNGISVYFTRILGNIWDGSLAIEKIVMKGNQAVSILESTASSSDLELRGLKDFLDKNFQFSPSSLGTASFSSPANLQQRLLGFMQPDGGASSQQVQQELQRKYHGK